MSRPKGSKNKPKDIKRVHYTEHYKEKIEQLKSDKQLLSEEIIQLNQDLAFNLQLVEGFTDLFNQMRSSWSGRHSLSKVDSKLKEEIIKYIDNKF